MIIIVLVCIRTRRPRSDTGGGPQKSGPKSGPPDSTSRVSFPPFQTGAAYLGAKCTQRVKGVGTKILGGVLEVENHKG